MTYAVTFDDVEVTIPAALRAALTAWPDLYVGRNTPTPTRPYMILVRRQGGIPRRVYDQPRLGFDVWAPTDQEANDLSRDLVRAMYALDARGEIKALSMSGPSEIPNADTVSRIRYLSADFRTRGSTLKEPTP